MKKYQPLSILLFAAMLCPVPLNAQTSVVNTVHNLSSSGPGTVKTDLENRVCVFCHTPHNSKPKTPLWNKDFNETKIYTTYESTTFTLGIAPPPGGPSRLCLSCHDGTIALGQLKSLANAGEGPLPFNTSNYALSIIGENISDDHPVSFSYSASSNPEMNPSPPSDLIFYQNDVIHCTTCHDAHDDTNGMFLRINNRESQLCITCHSNIAGWPDSEHNTDISEWLGIPGTDPDPWPHNQNHIPANQWITVKDNACQNCHKPHNAGGPQRLMMYAEEEKNCIYACHNGQIGTTDIASAFVPIKTSKHSITATIGVHAPNEQITVTAPQHVECEDCHNPHVAWEDKATIFTAPLLSSKLQSVTGVNSSGVEIAEASYEYEICFKCHGTTNQKTPIVQRVIDKRSLLDEFSSNNPSYHPVIGTTNNSVADVPSLGKTPYALANNVTVGSMIYCTDCHDNDESPKIGGTGPKGPHGSIYSPLLRENYKTTYPNVETESDYALCYRCHDRQSLIDDSVSMHYTTSPGHYGHVFQRQAPCSVCHDPHGVEDTPSTGSHTHLINFDTQYVTANPADLLGYGVPYFTDNGFKSGSCTLTCHDPLGNAKIHEPGGIAPNVNSSYGQ